MNNTVFHFFTKEEAEKETSRCKELYKGKIFKYSETQNGVLEAVFSQEAIFKIVVNGKEENGYYVIFKFKDGPGITIGEFAAFNNITFEKKD